jgi:hypothetical protein
MEIVASSPTYCEGLSQAFLNFLFGGEKTLLIEAVT